MALHRCAVGRHTFSGRSTSITCRCHQSLCSVHLGTSLCNGMKATDDRGSGLPGPDLLDQMEILIEGN